MTNPTRLQAAIDEAVATFTAELIGVIRQATVGELAGLQSGGTMLRRAQLEPQPDPEPATGPEPVSLLSEEADKGQAPVKAPRPVKRAPTTRQRAATKPKKKRAWPTCSVEGCDKKMFGPSGAKKLCYQHHLEAGGKPSPFAGKKKAEGPRDDAQAKPKSRKVIRRRKGEKTTSGASAAQVSKPKPAENPPLSGKDEGLRQVEARLAAKKP